MRPDYAPPTNPHPVHTHREDPGDWRLDVVTGRWSVRPPTCRGYVPLSESHTVTDHGDGTITVRPSLVYSTPDRDDYWHGWLERGVFRRC